MAFLEIKNLSVNYASLPALENINLSLNQGEIYSIIGPSGSGKSTLLHVLCGIINSYSGEILINNEPLNPQKHKIGFVPQNYGLLNWKTVKQNIQLPQRIRKEKITHKYSKHYNEIINGLKIPEITNRYPKELSGGQRQRVALARAFVQYPELLFMDEPFSALDALTSETSQQLFLDLWKQNKVTTIFTTHNIDEAVKMGKYIILLTPSPGRILKIIENPIYQKGASRNEEDFINLAKEIRQYVKQEWHIRDTAI